MNFSVSRRVACGLLALIVAAACGGAFAVDINMTRSLQVSPGALGGACKLVDMDGDGDLDLLYAYKTRDEVVGTATAAQFTFEWRQNNGTDTWPVVASGVYTGMVPPTNSGIFSNGSGSFGSDQITDIDTGDWDGDGDQDIVACNSRCGIFWLERKNAAGTSWGIPDTSSTGGTSSTGVAFRIYNGGAERITSGMSFPNVRRVRVGDLDADGRVDVAAAIAESGNSAGSPLSNGLLKVYWGNSGGASTTVDDATSLNISSLRVGGVAGDSKLDIVYTGYEYDTTIVAVHGSTARTFSLQTISSVSGENPNDVAIGDLDGDGALDIVKVTQGVSNASTVVAYRNTGTWTSAAGTTVDTVSSGNAYYVTCADMDNDGDLDIVVAMKGTNQVVYYENPRTATTWPTSWTAHYTSISPIDAGPCFLSAGEAQQLATDDAYPDLVVGSASSSTVSFYKNQTYNYGPSVQSVQVASDRTVAITFNKALMYDYGGSTSNAASVLNRLNYTISGAGRNDLSTRPTSVSFLSATSSSSTYLLTWSSGTILDGQDVTITCDTDLREADGTAPDYILIHAPLAATDSNRMTLSVASIYTYDNAGSATLTATATGGGASKQYRWVNASGTEVQAWNSSNTLTVTTFANGDTYKAFVNDGRLENVDSAYATINSRAAVTATAPASYSGRTGDSLSFSVTASGGYVPSYWYQWQVSHDGGTNWTDVTDGSLSRSVVGSAGTNTPVTTTFAGATTTTLSITHALVSVIPNTYDDGLYRCRVRDSMYPTYGTGGQGYSASATLTLENKPNLTSDPVGADKYVGNSHTFTVTAIGGTGLYVYTLKRDGTTVNSGASPSITLSPLTLTDQGNYTVTVADAYGSDTSASVLLNVRSALSLTALPAITTIRTGDSVPDLLSLSPDPFVLTATGGYGADAGHSYTYQWQHYVGSTWVSVPDGVVSRILYPGTKQLSLSTTYSGGASNHFTILHAFKNNGASSPTVFDDGDYRCLVDDGTGSSLTGSSAISDTATLNIEDKVNVITYPADATKKYTGETATFSITVIGGHGPYVSYSDTGAGYAFVWKANGQVVSGTWSTVGCTNTNTFNTQLIHNGAVICYVVDYYPGLDPVTTDTSDDPADLPVSDPVAASTPTGGHRNVGGSITLTCTGSNGYSPYTYQWLKGGTNLVTGTQSSGADITDVTQSSITISNLQVADSGNYTCKVTDSIATRTSSTKVSGAAVVSVTEPLTVGATTLVSSTHGQPNLYVGEAFTLGLATAPAGGTSPYHYTWKRDGASFGASDSAQLVVTNANASSDGSYSCTITDSGADDDVTSTALNINVYSHLALSQSPSTQSIDLGEPVSFTAAFSGGWPTVTYQWWHDPDGAGASPYVMLSDGGTVSGATAATLEISAVVQADKGYYKCIATDGGPSADTVSTTAATLTVTNNLHITTAGQLHDMDVYTGDTITLHVAVSGGFEPYHYLWKKVGSGSLSAGDSDTIYLSPAQSAFEGQYYVTVSDESGVNPSVDSNTATVTVYSPLAITASPVSRMVHSGDTVQFQVASTGGIPDITYQWEANTGSGFAPLSEGVNGMTGTNSANLSVVASLSENGAVFRCVVTAQPSSDTSSAVVTSRTSGEATLTVVPALSMSSLTGGRAYINAPADPAFDLKVNFSGGLNLSTYQWQRSTDGVSYVTVPNACCGNVGTANSESLTITPSAETPATYNYRLQILDDVSATYSNAPQIEFGRHLKIDTQPHDMVVGLGKPLQMCVSISGGLGGVVMQWMKVDDEGALTPITGASDECLLIDSAEEDDAGKYVCQMLDQGSTYSGTFDMLMSDTVEVTVSGGLPAAGSFGLLGLSTLLAALGAAFLARKRHARTH